MTIFVARSNIWFHFKVKLFSLAVNQQVWINKMSIKVTTAAHHCLYFMYVSLFLGVVFGFVLALIARSNIRFHFRVKLSSLAVNQQVWINKTPIYVTIAAHHCPHFTYFSLFVGCCFYIFFGDDSFFPVRKYDSFLRLTCLL